VVLRQMGARTVAEDRGVVSAAAEKPADPSGYNACWGMVAVTAEEAHRLPEVARKEADSPLPGAVALMVERIVNYNTTTG
jgi:hypothetical protein